MERLELEWCGEIVGYLAGPEFGGSNVSGRWLPSKSDLTESFLQFVSGRHACPWKKPERVDFVWKGEPKVAEVVDLRDRAIWLRVRHERIIFPKGARGRAR